MIIIQTNSLPLHLKSAFFGFNKAEYRTSLVSKSLPIKNPIFATHSNSATKTMHNVFSDEMSPFFAFPDVEADHFPSLRKKGDECRMVGLGSVQVDVHTLVGI